MSVASLDNKDSTVHVKGDEENQSWLRKKVVASGVRPRDVPLAFGMFIFVKWSLYMGGLGLCLRYHPLRKIGNMDISKRFLLSLRNKYPKRYEQIERKTFETAENIAQSPYFRPLPVWLRVDPKNFVYSLAENTILYKILFPIYAPTTIYFISRSLRPNTPAEQK